jgi:hypothetical protein
MQNIRCETRKFRIREKTSETIPCPRKAIHDSRRLRQQLNSKSIFLAGKQQESKRSGVSLKLAEKR